MLRGLGFTPEIIAATGDASATHFAHVASNWMTDPRYLSIWYGDMVGRWWCRVGMDKGECEALRYDPPPELEGGPGDGRGGDRITQ